MLMAVMLRRTGYAVLMAACLLASLRPANAQSDSVATVLKLQGMVSVIKDNSSYRTALYEGGQVRPGQLIVAGADGYAVFRVPDGSTFEVFPNSQLRFRATMSIGDLLNVIIGKVKIYIQHAPGIPNPNNVTTPTALISVRGTVFTVDVQDMEGTTAVSVDEGIVDVKNIRRGGNVVTLRPGEGITVDPNAPLVGLGGKGPRIYQALKLAVDAARDIMLQRMPGGGTSGPRGGPSGGQGDQGKPGQGGNTGSGSPTGNTGTGSPTGSSPGNPPPAQPGGGGGD
jgi:FecR protein